jgi:acyl carrier protein phosphodiesterase
MNYLAHLYLSGTNPEIIIGNMIEDFITGNIDHPRNNFLTPLMKTGVRMHREIDTLTDTHQLIKDCKSIFYSGFGKYSPIITDVICDHFIVKHWDKFTAEPFDEFRPRVYAALVQHRDLQPLQMQQMVDSMIKHDWLIGYGEMWGLERSFMNLNRRIGKEEVDLTLCLPLFESNYVFLEEKFVDFVYLVSSFCAEFLKINYPDGQ